MMDSSLAWPLTMEKCAEERQKSQGKHENAPIVAPAVSRSPKKAPRERSLQIDQKTEKKVKQVSDKVSECLQIVANEPSLGLFRLQEHVRRSILTLVTLKKDVNHVKQKVQGLVYDAEYGLKTLESMQGIESFSATQKHLKKAIDYKRRLNQKRLEKERRVVTGYYDECPVPSQFSPVLHSSNNVNSGERVTPTESSPKQFPKVHPDKSQNPTTSELLPKKCE
eukprot:m.261776 g.261776  ORF g.261776 m.261776 type:complete len:223 (+) comp40449_c1_seq7:32-700(+)